MQPLLSLSLSRDIRCSILFVNNCEASGCTHLSNAQTKAYLVSSSSTLFFSRHDHSEEIMMMRQPPLRFNIPPFSLFLSSRKRSLNSALKGAREGEKTMHDELLLIRSSCPSMMGGQSERERERQVNSFVMLFLSHTHSAHDADNGHFHPPTCLLFVLDPSLFSPLHSLAFLIRLNS